MGTAFESYKRCAGSRYLIFLTTYQHNQQPMEPIKSFNYLRCIAWPTLASRNSWNVIEEMRNRLIARPRSRDGDLAIYQSKPLRELAPDQSAICREQLDKASHRCGRSLHEECKLNFRASWMLKKESTCQSKNEIARAMHSKSEAIFAINQFIKGFS
jgi:hypothetical protein